MITKMHQWVAFAIAAAMCIAAIFLFFRYQDIQATHHVVSGSIVSVQSRSTRINTNSIQKLFHPMVKMPVDGEERILVLKQGGMKRSYKKGEETRLIYPVGSVEDVRFFRFTDGIWPMVVAGFFAIIALFTGIQLGRELQSAN
jgi:hypothetical protein